MWFEQLMGFAEENTAQVQHTIAVEGNTLVSKVNGQRYQAGELQLLSLPQLRARVAAAQGQAHPNTLQQYVGDVQALHKDPANANSLFQVASQFNLLEMVSPSVTPEAGVAIYQHDRTQGPACAIACGAGTIYRNYFVPLGEQLGQSSARQIDTLAPLAQLLSQMHGGKNYWQMRNGYALPNETQLEELDAILAQASETELETLRAALQIGLQWQTQVTLAGCQHVVSQAYCSALPVANIALSARRWQRFACLILEAAYEATLCAALLNAQQYGSSRVFLTLLGGGAFGNDKTWIINAMERALTRYRDCGLDVVFVSYSRTDADIDALIARLQNS